MRAANANAASLGFPYRAILLSGRKRPHADKDGSGAQVICPQSGTGTLAREETRETRSWPEEHTAMVESSRANDLNEAHPVRSLPCSMASWCKHRHGRADWAF